MGTTEEFFNDFCRTWAEIIYIEENKKGGKKNDT